MGGLQLAPPQVQLTAEVDLEAYRRKQIAIIIRHISGDKVIAVVEIVSLGNKSSHAAIRAFVDKGVELLFRGIHLLIIDLFPTGPRDPKGIHGAIWEEIVDVEYYSPSKPLTLVAYEAGIHGATTRASVQNVAVGDILLDMPLFLQPGGHLPL